MPVAKQPAVGPDAEVAKESPASSVLGRLADAALKGILLYFAVQITLNLWNILVPAHLGGQTVRNADAASKDHSAAAINSAWSFGQKSSLYVYISPEPIQVQFRETELKLFKSDITFGSFDPSQSAQVSLNVTIPSDRKDPYEPLYAHVYLAKEGHHPDPTKGPYQEDAVAYRRINLIGRMKRPTEKTHLLRGREEASPKKSPSSADTSPGGDENVPYWYPELHISLVQDNSPVNFSMLPFHMRKHYALTMRQDRYLPIVYLNDFWQLKDRRILLDNERFIVPLSISLSPMGLVKFQLLTNFDMALRQNEAFLGTDGETEKLKQMLFETNPYLLGLTLLVSLLHSCFDILAFKNDIQFWRKKDNLEGLSVRSVLVNALFQVIILLYLFDQETSWLILASVTVGTLIELWKITKVLKIRLSWSGGLPRLHIQDRAGYANSPTQHYDQRAMRYLVLLGIPLLLGYSVYALLTQPQKSWYSWTLGTLVGFVYSFGFIMMTPQLFINYKLKSVAHMPWRVFVYKALNTFIDDLFAFVIKMPTLHRLACFRDDVVFIIYLYQRWVYPVDKSRPNEYGQTFEQSSGVPEEEEEENKKGESGTRKAVKAPKSPAPVNSVQTPEKKTTRSRRTRVGAS